VRVTRALAPAGLPLVDTARIDVRAGIVCAAMALAVAVCVGALPAAWGAVDTHSLREGGRGATAGRAQLTARHALVVGQVAFALVLIAGSGLLLESVRRLRAVQPGFAVDGVLVSSVVMSSPGSVSDARATAFWYALETRLGALPGVVAVGATERVPLTSGEGCTTIGVEGRGEPGCIHTARVTPGFFRAMGIRVRGTTPDWTDADRHLAGAVITDAVAARLWPGSDPKGHGITSCERYGCQRGWYAPITAVALGVHDDGLDRPPPEIVYLPITPVAADTFPGGVPRGMAIVVRTASGDPAAYVPAVRRVLAELDAGAPLGMATPMRELWAASMARVTFTTALLSVAAGMAVLLAAVGLYGTLAYVVGLRRREIGVRMALGARAAQVRGLVVRQSAWLAVVGVALGLAGALVATRLLRSLLFEVAPGDPVVLSAGVALVGGVIALASYVPARRATRVDPTETLRAG
ncbi:MAG TPA: FtsX-like permease family protein, partial [Gemmatirosa sp.]